MVIEIFTSKKIIYIVIFIVLIALLGISLDDRSTPSFTLSRSTDYQSAPVATPVTEVDNVSDSISGKINLNTATAEELMTIKGIGETLSQRIIDYRDTHGKFNTVEELTKVNGIGEKRLAAMREFVYVD